MFTTRSDSLKSLKINFQKCKIATCPRLRRISICGLSDFCKIHQAYFFLVRLKYSMKKLFKTLSTSFAVLKKHSGDSCSLKDFCNIMNFINIPLMQEDVQNAFEVLSRSNGYNNTTVIKIDDMRLAMKSKSCKEVLEIEILIILEVVFKQIKETSIETVMAQLDEDADGEITVQDFIRVFLIRESQADLFFQNVFEETRIPLSRFFMLFSRTKKLSLELLRVDPKQSDIHFFSPKALPSAVKKTPRTVKSESMIEGLRDKLRRTFVDLVEAFQYYANVKMEIGFFQVQRMLQDFAFAADEQTCHRILFAIANGHTVHFKEFKEFWCGRRDLCNYEVCMKPTVIEQEYCETHIGIKKKRALVLLEKVKSQTAIWKSPRARIRFYNNLESASSKHDLVSIKEQLNILLPVFELPKSSLQSLHSIIGKINN